MRSNKKTKSGNENVVLLYPNSACSPKESVFSIDHILESIFAELDQESLLNCRLVSRRWLYFSSIALQKIVTLKCEQTYKDQRASSTQQVLICNGRKDQPIKDLVTLINNSTNFPCRSFLFNKYCRESNNLGQRFFNSHGTFISKLEFGEYLHLTDLKRLLLSQAPNLKNLVLNDVTFTHTEAESRCYKSETPEEGRQRRESLFSETIIDLNKPVFNNLKVFICDGIIPEIFLQQLLQVSPNLVQVFVRSKFLHHLVEPLNRIHLLKKLDVCIAKDNIRSLQTLANMTHPESWAVREVQFSNFSVYWLEHGVWEAAETFTKILKACSKTCQKLSWNNQLGNFHIPAMPSVRHFSLEYYENYNPTVPMYIFPEGVSLEDTFPNLESLEILSKHYSMVNRSTKNIFGDDNLLPVRSVQKVFLRFCQGKPGKHLIQSFQRMFPNAAIIEAE